MPPGVLRAVRAAFEPDDDSRGRATSEAVLGADAGTFAAADGCGSSRAVLLATTAVVLAFVLPSGATHAEGRRAEEPAPAKNATFKPAAEIRTGQHGRVLDRRRADDVERRAERHRSDAGHDVRPGEDDDADGDLPPLHRRLEEPAAAGRATASSGRSSRRRSATRSSSTSRTSTRATRTRCTSTACTTRSPPTARTSPDVSGPGADVKPGQTFTYKLEAGADSAGVWPYHDHSPSMDVVDPRRPVRRALDPRARARRSPTASSSSSSRSSSTSTRSTGSRSSTTRPRSARRSATSCSGTCSASATTTTASTCTATAGRPPTARATCRRSSPAESFVFRWKEDRAGTWLYHCHVEEHMMNGMIGLYVVTEVRSAS